MPELHKWRGQQSDSERQTIILLMLLYYNIATGRFFILLMIIRRLNISFSMILVMKMMMMMMMMVWWWRWKSAKQSEAQFLGSPTHLGHSDPKGPGGHCPPSKVAKKQAFFCQRKQIEFANIANPCVYRDTISTLERIHQKHYFMYQTFRFFW